MSTLARRLLGAADETAARQLVTTARHEALEPALEAVAGEVLRRLRDDPAAALPAAERAMLIAEASGSSRHRARAIWVRGHALAGVLRNEEALACYETAERLYAAAGDPVSAARTATGQVNTLMYLGRYERALQVGERGRQALARHGQAAAAARLDTNLGTIHYRRERHTDARRRYDRALRVARRLRDAGMAAQIQQNRINVLIAEGRIDRAERLARIVRDFAQDAGERFLAANADCHLGYTALLAADYDRAYEHLDTARAAFEALEHRQLECLTLIDLTELLLEMNVFVRAAALGRRARALAETLGMVVERAHATLLVGLAVEGGGRPRQAMELYEEARAAFADDGQEVSAALAATYLAVAEAAAGRRAAASVRLADACAVFARRSTPRQETMARVRRAAVELERGRGDVARGELLAARRSLRRTRSPWLAAQIDHLDGRLAARDGDARRAGRHYRRAVERVEALRSRLGIDEFRIRFADDKAPLYADLIDHVLARGGPRAVGEAFELVERSRSRALADLLSGRLRRVTRQRDDARARALAERLERLRTELNWLAGFDPEAGPGRRDERRARRAGPRLRACEAEIADLAQRLAHRDAALSALTWGETATLGDVQDELEPATALVEYFVGERASWAFVVEPGSARTVHLDVDRRRATELVTRLRFQMEKWGFGEDYARGRAVVMRETVDRHLTMIGELLWEPLGLDGERLERVTVVPHGPLHSLPFHALRLADGSALVDHCLVAYLPSASTRRYLGASTIDDRSSVLAVGVTDASIPLVEHELETVRGAFRRGEVLAGEAATRQRFAASIEGADVVHIATHGVFREDDPHFSALRLADGWLSLYDLYGLRTGAALVCLSACQSGRSWVSGGDELVGLVRGFLHAGAASLIVSLWPVQDASTARLMSDLYRRQRAGATPPQALREAMLALRDTDPHPYHWAPFVAIG